MVELESDERTAAQVVVNDENAGRRDMFRCRQSLFA